MGIFTVSMSMYEQATVCEREKERESVCMRVSGALAFSFRVMSEKGTLSRVCEPLLLLVSCWIGSAMSVGRKSSR